MHKLIMIDDPVGKAHYSLDVATKTAVKMPGGEAMFTIGMPPPGGGGFAAAGPGTAVMMTRTFERTAVVGAELATEDVVAAMPARRMARSSKALGAPRAPVRR